MHILVEGKKGTIKKFLNDLRYRQTHGKESVNFPEAYYRLRDVDRLSVSIDFYGNYVDFDILTDRKYRYLDIVCTTAAFQYEKRRQTMKVDCIDLAGKQNIFKDWRTDSTKGSIVKERTNREYSSGELEMFDEADVILDDYSTLELYEERLGKLNAF